MELSRKQYEDLGRKFYIYYLNDKVINTASNRKGLLSTLKRTNYRFGKTNISFSILKPELQLYFLWCCQKCDVATKGFYGDEIKVGLDDFIKVMETMFTVGDWEKIRRANKILLRLSSQNFTYSFKTVLRELGNGQFGNAVVSTPGLLKAILRVFTYKGRI